MLRCYIAKQEQILKKAAAEKDNESESVSTCIHVYMCACVCLCGEVGLRFDTIRYTAIL